MRVIGIIGSRSRNEEIDYFSVVDKFLELYQHNDIIVSGGCPKGADHFAEIISKESHVTMKIHKANWDKYGKSAGFQRNGYIADDSDILIACVARNRKGGTEDTIYKFLKKLKIDEKRAIDLGLLHLV